MRGRLLCLLWTLARRPINFFLTRGLAYNWLNLLFVLGVVVFEFKLLVLREYDSSGHDLNSVAPTRGLHSCVEDRFTEATSYVEERRVVLLCHVVVFKWVGEVFCDSRKTSIRHYHASRILKHRQQRLESTLVTRQSQL